MKKSFIKILSVMMLSSLLLTGCSGNSSGAVVAKVNGVEITKEDFDKTSLKVGKEYEMIFGEEIWASEVEGGKVFKDVFKDEILNVMVSQELVAQKAEKEGITVTDEEIANEVKSFMAYIGKVPTYTDFLKENNVDEEFLKEHFKSNLIFEKYRNKIMSETELKDEQLKEYYETHLDDYKKDEIKASHILISTLNEMKEPLSEDETAKKEAEAKAILKRVKAGEDFATLAKEYSDDDTSAVNGGDLGYFAKGVMVPEFEEAAFKMKAGEISELVKSTFGYHIIKVYDKKEEVSLFEDEKENILGTMRYEIYDSKMAELESDSKIEKFEDIMNK